jgi:hypothetical protein
LRYSLLDVSIGHAASRLANKEAGGRTAIDVGMGRALMVRMGVTQPGQVPLASDSDLNARGARRCLSRVDTKVRPLCRVILSYLPMRWNYVQDCRLSLESRFMRPVAVARSVMSGRLGT